MGRGGSGAVSNLPEEPDYGHTQEAQDRGPAENIHECPEKSLPAQLLIQRGLGGVEGVGGVEVAAQEPGQACDLLLKPHLGERDVIGDLRLVDVDAPGEKSLR